MYYHVDKEIDIIQIKFNRILNFRKKTTIKQYFKVPIRVNKKTNAVYLLYLCFNITLI